MVRTGVQGRDMTHEVFVSYRRADTSGHAGRICDDLERLYGHPVAFRDVENIVGGSDFVDVLEQAISRARVCVVLIGATWLSEVDAQGRQRLFLPDDHVRREIELALANSRLRVIPVLVEGAAMPGPKDLPASMERLARLQAVELSESRWDFDMQRLVRVLEGAGVSGSAPARMKRRMAVALVVLLAGLAVFGVGSWLRGSGDTDRYAGLWYLPNGSYWNVTARDGGLWVDEVHYDSREVWKRGPLHIGDDGARVTLSPVFENRPITFEHRLTLSGDGRSMTGGVWRSDRDGEQPIVLVRGPRP